MRRIADVNGASNPVYKAIACSPHMIGIDFETNACLVPSVYAKVGRNAAQGLRQGNGSAAMQDAVGLESSMVDCHPPLYIIGTYFQHLDPDMLNHRTLVSFPNFFQGWLLKPDRHMPPDQITPFS
jgi:hypothetical protein